MGLKHTLNYVVQGAMAEIEMRTLLDPHTKEAARIFNKPASEVTVEERRMAKTINFGVIYGKSTKK